MKFLRRLTTSVPIIIVAAALASCASIGREFPRGNVTRIQIGITTQEDIRTMFGTPWRTGIENGQITWTYGDYTYRLLGESDTSDLLIRFDDTGRVASYAYSTTEQEQ